MSYLLTAVIIILVIIILSASIKVVREYQRLVVFRLGRSVGARGPGLVFLIPIVDKPVWTDLRELLPGDTQPDLHHQRQRSHRHRLPDLLASHGPEPVGDPGCKLRRGKPGNCNHHAARRRSVIFPLMMSSPNVKRSTGFFAPSWTR